MNVKIDLNRIQDNPFQPRQSYGEVLELALKIRALKEELPDTVGLIHPPRARLVALEADGRAMERVLPLSTFPPREVEAWAVQLADGHRRFRAFQLLAHGDAGNGLDPDPDYREMPLVLAELPDKAMDDIAWDENYDRKDLTPVEEARALERTLSTFGLTQQELADWRRLSRSTVANKLRLLRLPGDLLTAVHEGRISERHGMAFLSIQDLPEKDLELASLTDSVGFNNWEAPTPVALRRRMVEKGDLTADEVRKVGERITAAIERAKRARWEGDRASTSTSRSLAPSGSTSKATTRATPATGTKVPAPSPEPPEPPQKLEMPPKEELVPPPPDVVVSIRIIRAQENGKRSYTLSIGEEGAFPRFHKGAYPDLLETLHVALEQFFAPPRQETLMEVEAE